MSYGTTFRKMREHFGVSTLELAREMGHGDRLVSMIEAGRLIPTKTLAAKATRALVEAHKKKAPGYSAVSAADQEPSQTAPNRQEGNDPMTIMLHDAADIEWHELPSDVTVALTCNIPGCQKYRSEHVLNWGESVHHTAFAWRSDEQCQVSVDYYEGVDNTHPLEANTWAVNGLLGDDDGPLTPARVSAFLANYNSAACLAAELNAGEASC
ncbi:helix-turn-helix transcriptional regulator [Curtobacterium sp. MCPF17_050]|uniref:helix-turn-helix domain-containing protein n=1 Tax=Curtobacterium sp. MCPF17_050 TaxID=2175664 RepID=UPI000D82A4DC|nr:helix-turn-helix transcriptional regulator [Curtobacterium sp. MCPF17_050]WIB16676.1 helix-turn-helix transcriptional regulator [Curtobacterium sp. MCPF17_050]